MYDPVRMQTMQSPVIPIIGALIGRYPGTISLGQGVVYYGPPPQAIEGITRFLADDANHRYQAVEGITELVAAITAKLRTENNILTGDERRVVVTAGGNMAFLHAVSAVTDPGDEIILQTPYYFNHEMAVTMAGCRAVLVPTDEDYQLRPEAIAEAITERTRAVLTVSPNNPTGAVYGEDSLRAVNTLCRERGIYHISDEAYEYFTYDGARHISPGALRDSAAHTISLYSLSKAYGFASWRIGYMVIPASLFGAVRKIQDTALICPPVISQYAAVGALEAGAAYCREKLGTIAGVREMVLRALESVATFCEVPRTDGAFYFLLKVNTSLHPMELVERLICEYGVAVLPGTTFGLENGCYLRVAYGALERETVAEGIERLTRGLKAIVKG